MSAPNLTISQYGERRVVTVEPAWAWRCEECGWSGHELASQYDAVREAGKHWEHDHALDLGANPLLELRPR